MEDNTDLNDKAKVNDNDRLTANEPLAGKSEELTPKEQEQASGGAFNHFINFGD
jgi:hypothetical protein